MPVKIIAHKLKEITIGFGYNNNPWTDEDEALIEALEMMYDKEVRMNAASDALMTDYFAANRDIELQRDELSKLANALQKLRSDADELRKHFGLPATQPFIDLAMQAAEVTHLVKSFRNGLVQHEEMMAKLCDRLNAALSESEDLTLWDEYSDIMRRHFKNYEINSIDITYYNRVDDERRNLHEFYANRRRNDREHCREIHDDNRCFVMESCVQLALWDEFMKRFSVLGYIFGQKEMLPGVWEN